MTDQKHSRRLFERDYLAILAETITPEVWREIVERVASDAKNGDAKARDWITEFTVGKSHMSLMVLAEREALGIRPEDDLAAMIDRELNPPPSDPVIEQYVGKPEESHLQRALRLVKSKDKTQ